MKRALVCGAGGFIGGHPSTELRTGFDCVLNEAISVLARRTREQRRPEQLDALLDQLARLIPVSDI